MRAVEYHSEPVVRAGAESAHLASTCSPVRPAPAPAVLRDRCFSTAVNASNSPCTISAEPLLQLLFEQIT